MAWDLDAYRTIFPDLDLALLVQSFREGEDPSQGWRIMKMTLIEIGWNHYLGAEAFVSPEQ